MKPDQIADALRGVALRLAEVAGVAAHAFGDVDSAHDRMTSVVEAEAIGAFEAWYGKTHHGAAHFEKRYYQDGEDKWWSYNFAATDRTWRGWAAAWVHCHGLGDPAAKGAE